MRGCEYALAAIALSPADGVYTQKLSKLAAPDPFTSSSQSIKDGSRKVGENKLLTRPGSSKNRFQVRVDVDIPNRN